MTDTIISSATREVVIGFDRPFVIIGERINPTGRKILAAEMIAGDYSRVIADALAQVEAGAQIRMVIGRQLPGLVHPDLSDQARKINQTAFAVVRAARELHCHEVILTPGRRKVHRHGGRHRP